MNNSLTLSIDCQSSSPALLLLKNCDWFAERFSTANDDIKLLGKGSYGTVYSVLDTTQSKHFAIKVMITSDLNEFNSLSREILNMNNLSHPNIMKFHECFFHPYLVTRMGANIQ
jgi:hypothetical protein